ncbi:hypothetical protein TR631_13640 [Streptomyces rochei]|uniref:hypothetical protein n=1 Tax=Streptomyces sp. AN-3 TaxID=3044177 RepID=UPI002ACDFF74|nr:hypothetical protein [Streptomyces rochei]WQC12805.1 hypothetical protein TR631_13640 [Streptomyces rochei]
MTRVIGHLADLSHLSTDCPGENHDWMITLTRAAERSVYAITTSVDREFWNSEPAGRYLDAQQEAIDGRGVRVRRLFLLESARELDDRLLRLCEEQELRRIDVRAAVLPELPPHLQRGTTDDFVLYDEEVSFEIEQDLRDVNVRTRLTARQDRTGPAQTLPGTVGRGHGPARAGGAGGRRRGRQLDRRPGLTVPPPCSSPLLPWE